MRKVFALVAIVAVVVATGALFAEEGAKQPPKPIVYESKMGPVTFDHVKHGEKAKGDCTVCHDKLFAQKKGDLGYKESMHKKAEEAKTSCGACHHAGGASFETKGNCQKCHVKK